MLFIHIKKKRYNWWKKLHFEDKTIIFIPDLNCLHQKHHLTRLESASQLNEANDIFYIIRMLQILNIV